MSNSAFLSWMYHHSASCETLTVELEGVTGLCLDSWTRECFSHPNIHSTAPFHIDLPPALGLWVDVRLSPCLFTFLTL